MLGAWFAHYLSLNKRDSIWMKLFVAGLVLLTTLKSLQSLAMMWIQNGHLVRRSGSGIQHMAKALGLAISRNVYLVITCITLFLLGLVSGVVMTFYIFTNTMEVAVRWVGIHLGVVLCGDLLLTGSTICYLLVCPATLTSMRLGPRTSRNHPQPLTAANTAGK
ncbi:hypothetical protein B0H14DRAFT_3151878 [Mycena olivaceomarginata]|nr:hypothetical protein B0H14DRAFT_3151878 [Mycena olivaceomarginata]